MPPHRKPQPLHKSLTLIEEERRNVAKRTQQRIAQLYADETKRNDFNKIEEVQHAQWLCCVNNICFCVLLVIVNLLFFQWVYYKTNIRVQEL